METTPVIDEKEATRLRRAVIYERKNVGMLEPAQNLDFTTKALFTDERGDLGTENLDGDLLLLLEVIGKNDISRRASTDLRPVGVAWR